MISCLNAMVQNPCPEVYKANQRFFIYSRKKSSVVNILLKFKATNIIKDDIVYEFDVEKVLHITNIICHFV